MKKHYFLGTAASYSRTKRLELRKSKGARRNLDALYDYLGKEYGGKVIVTRNGRSAIAAGLKYHLIDLAGAKPGDEVIINGFTCYAVVQGVEAAGFTPVYADINKETLNFTLDSLKKSVTTKTKAVIVQNTLGNMVDIREIQKFCKEHNLVLIEDLAHSVGRFYHDGREAGKVGDIVIFSFGKEKSIDAINGGAVVFRNPKVNIPTLPRKPLPSRQEFRARIYPGIGKAYRGLSYVGIHNLFMGAMIKTGFVTRSADDVVDYTDYTMSFIQAKLALEGLKSKSKLKDQPIREFYLVKHRDELLKKLKKAGFYLETFWYEKPVSPARYYSKIDFPEAKCPVAVEVSKQIINLPTYFKPEQLEKARKIITEWKEND